MSSGTGSASRLYETTDGCAHWHLLFTNPDPTGFWDAIAFSNTRHGMLLGDPVNGRFTVFTTNDGGRRWSRDDSPALAADPHGEGAFAASNSSLFLSPDANSAWFATGGAGRSRIFHLHRGIWTSLDSPLAHSSESTGIFSIVFRNPSHGVVTGGDYRQPNNPANTAAWTSDGGATWTAASKPPAGYRSAVAWDQKLSSWIAVGPNGSDISSNDGQTWKQIDQSNWNALSLPWAVGPNGKIAMLNESILQSIRKPSK